jgi:hypothetical protein
MLFDSDTGIKFVSIILGFGLATLFRQSCKDDSCRIIKGPNIKELEKRFYKIDDKCYRYKPVATMCTEEFI